MNTLNSPKMSSYSFKTHFLDVVKGRLWAWFYGERLKHGGKKSFWTLSEGGHQGFRECVHGAGSHGGALTLVSFTKGVSPPERPTRSHPVPQTLTLTKEEPRHKHPPISSECWRRAKQQMLLLKSQHTPGLEKCLDASPSISGPSQSPLTCPAAPLIHINWSICPLIRQDLKARGGFGDRMGKAAL